MRRLSSPARFKTWLLLPVLALVALVTGSLLHQQHLSRVAILLEKTELVQSVSWRAVINGSRNSVFTYFDEYVQKPATHALLRMAQDPRHRDRARLLLLRHLYPVYEVLHAKGIRQFHFHLPNGDSLLRFHHVERFGDNLFEARESIRIANTERVPVFGFEAGRVVSGYRSVLPIFDENGMHLGSVELSLPFSMLVVELNSLMPEREFELLLLAEPQRAILFSEQQSLYGAWPGSDRFLIEDPHQLLADTPAPVSEQAEQVRLRIAQDESLQSLVETTRAHAFRVKTETGDYVVSQTPIVDPRDQVIGLLMSYAVEPGFASIDLTFQISALLGVVLLTLIGAGSHLLFVKNAEKLADRQRLQTITQTLGEGLYVTDEDGLITDVNPRAVELLGHSREDLLGYSAHRMFHRHAGNDHLPASACPIITALMRGETFKGEEVFARADGSLLEVRVASSPILEYGRYFGAVTVFEDISEEKVLVRLQQDAARTLAVQAEALTRSNAELEQFAYVVSHDLRQPLRMINSYMQLLERRLAGNLDDEGRQMMHFASDAATRMDQMLLSLLEYSRVGRMGEPMSWVDTRVLVEEAARYQAPVIARTRADFRIEGEWPVLWGSRDELARLLQNLLGNAFKYQHGEVPPQVTIRCEADPHGWQFCVQDNGIGIDPAQFDRLFRVFQRLHARDRFEGSGVGLAICRKIVERHGGRIWVSSDGEGKGCRFCFVLPGDAPREG